MAIANPKTFAGYSTYIAKINGTKQNSDLSASQILKFGLKGLQNASLN